MPRDFRSNCDPLDAPSVQVAIYDHPHGTDIRVSRDADQAMRWRTNLAREWWSHAYDDEPPPDDEIGEAYFERMRDHGEEFFSTMMCRVEGSDPDSANQPDRKDGA